LDFCSLNCFHVLPTKWLVIFYRACARGGKTNRALSLLQVVKDKGLPIDSYCYTAVIDACAKGGMWKKALSLLEEMQTKGIAPTEVTYR
jgi:pentatricopeptide repeat domain-containing protein 1